MRVRVINLATLNYQIKFSGEGENRCNVYIHLVCFTQDFNLPALIKIFFDPKSAQVKLFEDLMAYRHEYFLGHCFQ